MTSKYQARLIFPSIFHEYIFDKIDFDREKLIEFCYLQKEKYPDGLHRSNNGGWHSPIYNAHDEDNILSDQINKGLANSLFTTIKDKLKVRIEYWIMINSPNTYNITHTHPNAHFSGVLWIKTPENSGNLKFHNPNTFERYVELNSYVDLFKKDTNTHEAFIYEPEEGMLISFPSHVAHRVLENKSTEDRIAVSYNISLIGQITDDD